MSDAYETTDTAGEVLTRAARQLLAIENLFGGEFLPAGGPELPAFEPAKAAEAPEMPPERKAEALAEIDEGQVRGCTKCILSRTRANTVFGEGAADAELVFVGEGPGHDEDVSGRPFVGRAGELLTNMIHAMGLSREDVYICNIVKCRPPNNRNPMPEETEACWGYLVAQLEIIRPKVIVTLGNPATKRVLDTREGITRLRGNWRELGPIGSGLGGTPVMPTFHPAYVARRYTPEIRGRVWSDLRKVMALLGLKLPQKKGE